VLRARSRRVGLLKNPFGSLRWLASSLFLLRVFGFLLFRRRFCLCTGFGVSYSDRGLLVAFFVSVLLFSEWCWIIGKGLLLCVYRETRYVPVRCYGHPNVYNANKKYTLKFI
jgi:hypothetical protein